MTFRGMANALGGGMPFDTISPWVQHALSLTLFASVVLLTVALVLIGGARLLQLRRGDS